MLMLAWLIGVCLISAVTWHVTGRLLRWQLASRVGGSAVLPVLFTWIGLMIAYVDWAADTPERRGWQLVVIIVTLVVSLVAVFPALAVAWMIEGRWGHLAP